MIQEIPLTKSHKESHKSEQIPYVFHIEMIKGVHINTKRIPVDTGAQAYDKKEP